MGGVAELSVLGCLLCSFPGHQALLTGSITESLPPEVPARPSLTLPPDIDQFPFSSFVSTSFQVSRLWVPGIQKLLCNSHQAQTGVHLLPGHSRGQQSCLGNSPYPEVSNAQAHFGHTFTVTVGLPYVKVVSLKKV